MFVLSETNALVPTVRTETIELDMLRLKGIEARGAAHLAISTTPSTTTSARLQYLQSSSPCWLVAALSVAVMSTGIRFGPGSIHPYGVSR